MTEEMPNKGPKPKVPDKRLIEIVGEHEVPVASAGDVADKTTISRQSVDRRLRRLAEEGKIQQGKLGEYQTVYWSESSESGDS